MSYRPQVKQPNGQMVDIPLDAETVKGKNVSAEINNIISGAQVVGNATNDGQGRNIANTYALKSEVGTKKYNHFITIKIEDNNTAHAFMLLYKTTQSSKFQTVDQLYDEFNSKGFTSENAIYPASGQYKGQMIIGCYVSTSMTGPGITYKKINFLQQAETFISINGSAANFDNGIVTDIVMED